MPLASLKQVDCRNWSICRFVVLIPLQLAGCAAPVASDHAATTPLSLDVSSKKLSPAKIPELSTTTRSVRLKIRVRKNSQNPLHQRFEVDEELVADSDAQLSAKLNDLPINIPAHRVGKRIWELDFTPNILELLAKGSTPSHYSGVLVLDHSGKKNLPLTLVLNQLPAETSSVRSAG